MTPYAIFFKGKPRAISYYEHSVDSNTTAAIRIDETGTMIVARGNSPDDAYEALNRTLGEILLKEKETNEHQ